MTRGLDLAAKHIEAAGGPERSTYIYLDHKSGDAAAGEAGDHRARREEGRRQVRLLRRRPRRDARRHRAVQDLHPRRWWRHQHLRPGHSRTSGAPVRSRRTTRCRACFKYLKETYPDKKTVGLVGWDIGEPSNGIIKEDILKKIADAGYEFNGLYELVPVGGQDFSQVLPKIKANEPDILLVGIYGQDPGLVRQPGGHGRPRRCASASSSRPTASNASKGTLRQRRLHVRLRLLRRQEPGQPAGQVVRQRVQVASTARIPTSTPRTSTRTRS